MIFILLLVVVVVITEVVAAAFATLTKLDLKVSRKKLLRLGH